MARVKENPPMHQAHTPRVVCEVGESLLDTALELMDRLRHVRRSRGCAGYLFVDHAGRCYVISEDRQIAQHWIRDHIDWLVGRYVPPDRRRNDPMPGMDLTVDGLVEDLADHLRQLHAEPADDLYRPPGVVA